jgi:hypothetical protein
LQVKAQAPPVQRGEALTGVEAEQSRQEAPQCAASAAAKQEVPAAPQTWKPASQATPQVPAPTAGPDWQTPRPPAAGPGQAAQLGPQLASVSGWQVACPPAAAGQSRVDELHAKPQAPWTQAGTAFTGALQAMHPPPHLSNSVSVQT